MQAPGQHTATRVTQDDTLPGAAAGPSAACMGDTGVQLAGCKRPLPDGDAMDDRPAARSRTGPPPPAMPAPVPASPAPEDTTPDAPAVEAADAPLMSQLQAEIAQLQAEIAQLQAENTQVKAENTQVTAEKEWLQLALRQRTDRFATVGDPQCHIGCCSSAHSLALTAFTHACAERYWPTKRWLVMAVCIGASAFAHMWPGCRAELSS
jgi:hypothetical protein